MPVPVGDHRADNSDVRLNGEDERRLISQILFI